MRINFVTVANENMASYRYHIQIPARELTLLGHACSISHYPEFYSDVYVFSKHMDYGNYWDVKALKREGKKTVFHCCDNHFDTKHRDHYLRMLDEVDSVIVPTETMKHLIEYYTGRRNSVVIPEPYEFPQISPSYEGINGKLKILWFGHPSNLESLQAVLPLDDCELRFCSLPPIPSALAGYLYVPWCASNLTVALSWCDCVIIPFQDTEKDRAKSPNRLIETVRRGKFAVASAIPTYLDFDEWIWIGDIHEGLQWFRQQPPEEINKRVMHTQTYIEENHSPERIAKLWELALK